MTTRVKLARRKFSSGKKVMSQCQATGAMFPYDEMVFEPGTGLWVHKSESDGAYNRVDNRPDPIIPADARTLEHTFPPPPATSFEYDCLYDPSLGGYLVIQPFGQMIKLVY